MNDPPNIYQAPSEDAERPQIFPNEDLPTWGAAGFGIRAGARMIDMVVGFGMGYIAGIAGGAIGASLAASGSLSYGWQRRAGELSLSSFGLSLLGPLAYHTAAEATGGASLGKLILGLRVRREDMSPCGVGGALVRNLLYYVDAFFCGIVGYMSMSGSRWQQRLGDKAGKTVVVNAASLHQYGPLPGTGGGIAVGLILWALIALMSMLVKMF